MGKRNRFTAFLIILCCMFFMLFMGCSKPPTQEVENAEKTIANAKKAEADLYVQDIFTKAENSLKQANDLITQKKYKEAKAAAEEAAKLALEAIPQIEPNKAKMKEEATQKVSEAQMLMKEVKDIASKAIKKKVGPNQDELKTAIGDTELEMVNINESMQAEKIRQAYDKIIVLLEQLKSQKENLTVALEQKQTAKK
jgi:HEPN domain-containing protein